MARNKHPEETINRILDISYTLFMEKGYEQTTIQDIVNELGMSKGAIYHHFKSKEEIIEALCRKRYEIRGSEEIINQSSLNGLQKIKALLIKELGNAEKQNLDKLSVSLFDNPRMMSETLKYSLDHGVALLQRYVEEGIKDGSIHADDAKGIAELIMICANVWINPLMNPQGENQYYRKILLFQKMMHGLGVDLVDDEILDVCKTYMETIKPM